MLCRQKCSTSMRQTNPPPYFSPVIRMKCWLFTFLQARCKWIFLKWRDIFQQCWRDIFDKTLGHFQVMLMATKPCIFDNTWGHFPAVLVATKPDISDEKLGWFLSVFVATTWWDEMFGHFQAMLMTTKLHIFDRTLGPFQAMPGATTQEMFDEERDNFQLYFWRQNQVCQNTIFLLNLTSGVFVPKLTQTLSTALWKHRIENLTLNHKCSGNWVSMFFFLFTTPLCWLVVFIFS